MSFLLAAVSAVVATPTPSPTVIKEVLQPVVQQVPVTPPEVLQLAQLLATVAAGALTSTVHQLVDRGRFSGNFNRLLLTLYSTAAALAVAFLTGHLGWNTTDATVLGTGFVAALAGATSRYNLFQFVKSFSEPKLVDASDPVPAALPAE